MVNNDAGPVNEPPPRIIPQKKTEGMPLAKIPLVSLWNFTS